MRQRENEDASTADDVRALLGELEASGTLSVDGARWRLLHDLP